MSLFNQPLFSDGRLILKDKQRKYSLPIHKAILARGSEFFRGLFTFAANVNKPEIVVEVENVEAAVELVKWIYNAKPDRKHYKAEFHQLADQWLVPDRIIIEKRDFVFFHSHENKFIFREVSWKLFSGIELYFMLKPTLSHYTVDKAIDSIDFDKRVSINIDHIINGKQFNDFMKAILPSNVKYDTINMPCVITFETVYDSYDFILALLANINLPDADLKLVYEVFHQFPPKST